MIEVAIRSLLVNDSAVAAIVDDRVYTDQIPQADQVPAIVLDVRSEDALDAMDGPLGMDQTLMRVYAYSLTRPGASTLRLAARTALGGFQGIVSGLWIKGVAQEPNRGQTAQIDRVRLGTDQYRYVCFQDFRISYDYEPVE